VEPIKTGAGETVQIVHNEGVALTGSAMRELTGMLKSKADVREFRLTLSQVKGVLDGYRLPLGGLELLVIQRYGDEGKAPWVLMKVGKPTLAGVNVELYELLDLHTDAAARIVDQGLMLWQ
jgi:hypothetical protein